MAQSQTFNFGYKPDPADERDLALEVSSDIKPSVDQSRFFPPLISQGGDPACVGFAVANVTTASLRIGGHGDFLVSPYGIWYWSRSLEGEEDLRDGTHVRTALKAITHLGLPAAADFEGLSPHRKIPRHDKAPGARVLKNSFKWRGANGYKRIYSTDGIRSALSQNKLVVFGIDVNQAFLNKKDSTAIDVFADKAIGGHALGCAGYNQNGNFLIANSMGQTWGENGFCWFTERMMSRARDIWAIEVLAKH